MPRTYNKYIIVSIIIIMLTTGILAYIKRSEIVWIEDLMPITSVNTDKKVVSIVCNVYEGEDILPKMLNVLDEKNIKATFFMGGIWASKNPETVRLIKNRGHEIQNHGYYHRLPTTISKQNNIKEIKDTEELIYNICGIRTKLFEPPSGDFDENTLNIVHSLNYKLITWNIDTIDWRNDATRELILSRIKRKLQPGSIILTHPKAVTADSFSDIIDLLISNGYEIVTVSKLLEYQ